MKYKHLFTLLLVALVGHASFAKDANQLAADKAKELRQSYGLSVQQEDSLKVALPAYFNSKAVFLQQIVNTVNDTRNLQKQHDDILKKFLTAEQYSRYDSVWQFHLQLMKQRTNTTGINP